MPDKPVMINFADVTPSIQGSALVITSPELVDVLIHDQPAALNLLAQQASTVAVTDISIDSLGRVVINNQAFVDAVKAKFAQEVSQNNLCGVHCIE